MADEFTLGVTIMPRHVFSVDENGEPISFDFSSKEFADGFNNHWANNMMCGTGPMVFERWDREKTVRVETVRRLLGIAIFFSANRYISVSRTRTHRFKRHCRANSTRPGSRKKTSLYSSKDYPTVKDGKVRREAFEYPGYRYIGYNQRRAVFKDRRFRLAMAHAIPVQQIIDEVFEGLAVPVVGPFLPGSSQADPSIKPVEYNLDEARKLLDEALWRDTDGDGIRDKMIDGKKVPARFELLIYSDAPVVSHYR